MILKITSLYCLLYFCNMRLCSEFNAGKEKIYVYMYAGIGYCILCAFMGSQFSSIWLFVFEASKERAKVGPHKRGWVRLCGRYRRLVFYQGNVVKRCSALRLGVVAVTSSLAAVHVLLWEGKEILVVEF